MAGDAVLWRDGPVSVPLDYQVPQSGELLPINVEASIDGSAAASSFYAVLQVLDPNGRSMGKYRSDAIAAGGSADVTWFPGAELEETTATTGESLFLDTRNPSGVTTSFVLTSGQQYLITATGTWSYTNHALDVGSPEANALYPTPGRGANSTQVGFDCDTVFAYYSGDVPAGGIGHSSLFQMNLGSGYSHVEPASGARTTPSTGHVYNYNVTGQGSAASFLFVDAPGQYGDNYGYVLITITPQGQTNTPAAGPNHAILRSNGTNAVWEAQPDITESDLSLSDVTTGNVSASRHGFAPKAPNDGTKYLDGTGAYTVPSGASSPGSILGFGTQSSDKTATGTNFAGGTDLLGSTISFTADGTSSYLVTVHAPGQTNTNVQNNTVALNLDGSAAGIMSYTNITSLGQSFPVAGQTVITPSAGAHTVNARYYTSGNTATMYASTSLGSGAVISVVVYLL